MLTFGGGLIVELVTELSEDLLNEQSDDEDDYSESTDSNLSSISESVGTKPGGCS